MTSDQYLGLALITVFSAPIVVWLAMTVAKVWARIRANSTTPQIIVLFVGIAAVGTLIAMKPFTAHAGDISTTVANQSTEKSFQPTLTETGWREKHDIFTYTRFALVLMSIWMWKCGKASGAQRHWQWLKSWAAALAILFVAGCITTALWNPNVSATTMYTKGMVFALSGVYPEIVGMIAWLVGRFGTNNGGESSQGAAAK